MNANEDGIRSKRNIHFELGIKLTVFFERQPFVCFIAVSQFSFFPLELRAES